MTFGVAELVAVAGVRDQSMVMTLGGVRVDTPSTLDRTRIFHELLRGMT
jgi:hypothetical protein